MLFRSSALFCFIALPNLLSRTPYIHRSPEMLEQLEGFVAGAGIELDLPFAPGFLFSLIPLLLTCLFR